MPTSPQHTGRRFGPPAQLTADDLVDAALAVGLEQFTIKDLARQLGVASPALYRWIADREEVLDLVADRAASHVEAPALRTDHDWRRWLADFAAALRRELEAWPGAAARGLTRYQISAPWITLHAHVIEALVDGGMERARAPQTAELFCSAVLGWIAREQALQAPRKDGRRIADEIRAARAAAGVATRTDGRRTKPTADERFRRLVAVLVAGIAATA